jgi:hypothetical protein
MTTPAATRLNEGILFLPGVGSNYASCPDSVALSITGDLDVRFIGDPLSYNVGSTRVLIAKANTLTNDSSYRLQLTNTGNLQFVMSALGTSADEGTVTSSIAIPEVHNVLLGMRCTWRQSDKRAQFFTSRDLGATWTQLGVDRTTSKSSIFDSVAPLEIGSRNAGTSAPFAGSVYYAEVRNGINGTIVASANFSTNKSLTFTDPQSNNWTINTSGGNPARIISKSASTPRSLASARTART